MSEQPARYERSTSGMVGALVATVLVILAFVAFRSLNRSQPDERPRPVDYLASIRYLQQAGRDVVYPGALPSHWFVSAVDDADGSRPGLGLSMLTAKGEYVGFQQSSISIPDLLTTYVDPSPTAGRTVTLSSPIERHWAVWTDSGGDTALAGHWHHQSLLVFGSASQADLETIAESLTTARVPKAATRGK